MTNNWVTQETWTDAWLKGMIKTKMGIMTIENSPSLKGFYVLMLEVYNGN